jgi:hypothetical protein
MSDNTKLIESPPLYEDICKNNENGDRNDIIDINVNICTLMCTLCCNKLTYCFTILHLCCNTFADKINSIRCSCCDPCLDKFNNCCCKCCSCCNECNPPDI